VGRIHHQFSAFSERMFQGIRITRILLITFNSLLRYYSNLLNSSTPTPKYVIRFIFSKSTRQMNLPTFTPLQLNSTSFVPSTATTGLKTNAPIFTLGSADFVTQPSTPFKSNQEEPQVTKKKTRRGTKGQEWASRQRKKLCKGKTPSEIIGQWGIDRTKYKTEICKNWIEIGTCRYGSKCQFAHGDEEKEENGLPYYAIGSGGANKYKSKDCSTFLENLWCPYGTRCLFRHEVRTLEEVHERVYATRIC
jgi:hypothetical protein